VQKPLVLARELSAFCHSRAVILAAPVALRAAPTHWSSSMTSGLPRPAWWSFLWLVCLTLGLTQISPAAEPAAVVGVASGHVDQYLAQRRLFMRRLQHDPAAAVHAAEKRVQ
jgi:hypothetical protein